MTARRQNPFGWGRKAEPTPSEKRRLRASVSRARGALGRAEARRETAKRDYTRAVKSAKRAGAL